VLLLLLLLLPVLLLLLPVLLLLCPLPGRAAAPAIASREIV
jgi:hypothetical protein